MPKLVVGSSADTISKVNAPDRPKRKNFKQNLVEKSGKVVTDSKVAKDGKDSSKWRKKNPAPDTEVNVEGVKVVPPVVSSTPINTTADITPNLVKTKTPRGTPVADTSGQTPVER